MANLPLEHESSETKPGPSFDTLLSLQKLVEALEKGDYNAAPAPLIQGSWGPDGPPSEYAGPLQVESLEPYLRVVTFEDPGTYKLYANRFYKLMRLCRFLHLRSWAHMFDLAGGNAELRAKELEIKLRKDKFR